MFVDYAGQTVDEIDAGTGEVRPAQIFVAIMGAVNYTYVEATLTQSLPDWIGSARMSGRSPFMSSVLPKPTRTTGADNASGTQRPGRYIRSFCATRDRLRAEDDLEVDKR
jgi:hypothetical protein